MGMNLAEMRRLANRAQSLQKSSARAREKLGEITSDLVRAAEVSGVSLALGYIQGKRASEGKELMRPFGMPLELGLGVAGHVLAVMGVGGAEDHFKAIGDASLATYFSNLGYNTGKSGKKLLSGEEGGGYLPRRMAGQSLTADDLARLATE